MASSQPSARSGQASAPKQAGAPSRTSRAASGSARSGASGGLLRQLGIVGWERLEPVVVAALATEAPLLIVGPHGTAKSLLLNRLAEALGLRHRHYNASTVNFDDLVGYPFPDKARRAVRFIPTPCSIWGAESVFVDEISRCRLDLQNRLFPIIHERRIQGMPLEGLRYRWAAMNPPAADDDLDGAAAGGGAFGGGYRGAEPLDLALADRFPFVIEAPCFADLDEGEQRAVIAGAGVAQDAAIELRERVAVVRRLLPALRAERERHLVEYVRLLLPLVARFALAPSPRRAAMLFEGALAVEAACAAQGAANRQTDPAAAWFLALRAGLPDAALGRAVDPAKLLAAHRQTVAVLDLPAADPRRLLVAEDDPVRRAALALRLGVDGDDAARHLLDAVAGLPVAERLAFAAAFYPAVCRLPDLPCVVYETLADLYADVASPEVRRESVTTGTPRWRRWQSITAFLGGLEADDEDGAVLRNLCFALFARDEPFEPEALAERYRELRRLARRVQAARTEGAA